MIIQNNSVSGRAYVPYTQSISNLAKSAQRLATGNSFANASDGTGELGVADRMRLNITAASSIVSTMENALGFASTQDDIMSAVSDMIARMNELAASAVDATKTTADRTALNVEFRALDAEIANYANSSKYNGLSLFQKSIAIRTGVESTDSVDFSAIDLSLLTFVTLSVTTAANASIALVSLRGRAASLQVLRNMARSNGSRIERTLAISRGYIANLSNSESKIRDVDVATETGEFTKNQVLVQAAQSVLAQVNQLSQNALRFLQ
jgi:flagellin